MIGSICVSTKASYLDLLPNEILEIVMYYLGEEDLNNLTSKAFGSERIENSASNTGKEMYKEIGNSAIQIWPSKHWKHSKVSILIR